MLAALRRIAPGALVIALVARGAAEEPGPGPRPLHISGTVVDESGSPVAGAEVRIDAYTPAENRAVTDADGRFTLVEPASQMASGRSLVAAADGGRRIGVHPFDLAATSRRRTEAPVRIVVRPARPFPVRVRDAEGRAVADAEVEAVGVLHAFSHATTDDDGRAVVHAPADARVEWLVARKVHVGFDFVPVGGDGPPAPDGSALTLGPPRTIRLRALDDAGNPAPGVTFVAWYFQVRDGFSNMGFNGRIHAATTDGDGIAAFDWLPRVDHPITFFPSGEGVALRRTVVEGTPEAAVDVRLSRPSPVRGRVALPDGSPAKDVRVLAQGRGYGEDLGVGMARTADDGTYTLRLAPDEMYAVYVDDDDLAAPTRRGVLVEAGKPVDGVDFRLERGTLLHGQVDRAPGAVIYVYETTPEPPDEVAIGREGVFRVALVPVDARGRYALRVGPGTYVLDAMDGRTARVVVTDQQDVVPRLQRPEPSPPQLKAIRN